MDITTNTNFIPASSAAIKTPETGEYENPPRIQIVKPVSFSNGVLKRHQPLHLRNTSNRTNHSLHATVVNFKECLKNHAASIGGHAVDGCGEFMPSPGSNPANPTSLKCAACGCHRNFHRRETEAPVPPPPVVNKLPALEYQPHHRHHPPPPPPPQPPTGDHSSPSSPSPPPISSSYYPSAPHMLLALSSGMSGPPPDNNNNNNNNNNSTPMSAVAAATATAATASSGRKRFRTKFSQDQKDKMLEFAERVGWKIQRRDDDVIKGFCNEVGVKRGVLKVWMHNNKNTLGKKENNNTATNLNVGFNDAAAVTAADAAVADDYNSSGNVGENTNGSSSST